MNLWFRLLRVFWRSWWCRKTDDVFFESRISFRVWPSDLDLNLHMNNGRYLTLMDLGRTFLMAQVGILWQLPKRRWFPVVGAVDIQYYRSLDPFQKFELVTRVLTWDEKWFYVEQRFERKGNVLAKAYVRALFLGPGGKVLPEEVVGLANIEKLNPPQDPILDFWKDSVSGKA